MIDSSQKRKFITADQYQGALERLTSGSTTCQQLHGSDIRQ
jgi:hypothetical protein